MNGLPFVGPWSVISYRPHRSAVRGCPEEGTTARNGAADKTHQNHFRTRIGTMVDRSITRQNLKKNVADELFDMGRERSVLSNDDNQLTRESFWQPDANEFLLLVIQCKGPDGDKADPHPQRDQIDDQIKAIELHRGFNGPAFALHPRAQLSARLRFLVDQ